MIVIVVVVMIVILIVILVKTVIVIVIMIVIVVMTVIVIIVMTVIVIAVMTVIVIFIMIAIVIVIVIWGTRVQEKLSEAILFLCYPNRSSHYEEENVHQLLSNDQITRCDQWLVPRRTQSPTK